MLKFFQRLFLAIVLAVLTLMLFLALLEPIQAASLSCLLLLAPSKLDMNPPGNTHTASNKTTVSIMYNEPINPSTVSSQTFAVHARQSGLLIQTYQVDRGIVSLTPTKPFRPGELVQISATTGTLNLSGQGPIEPIVWQFWTAAESGSGIFTDSGQSLSFGTYAVALGDLNGDNHIDAFIGNYGPSKVWLNDGTGVFSDTGQNLGNETTTDVALGDVDGDGDLDAFVANANIPDPAKSKNTVWLNDGTGVFTNNGQELGQKLSYGVALGDVDGDGDLDAFVGNGYVVCGQTNEVWLNNGAGIFSDSGQNLKISNTQSVALGDVDGDGDLDALVGNRSFINPGPCSGGKGDDWVLLNNGAGVFTNSGQNLGDSETASVILGDLNGDSHLDAFIGNEGPDRVWLNDGTGVFTDTGQSLGNSDTRSVTLGDVDADGDLDALVGNFSSQCQVWLNDGMGIFTDTGQSLCNSNTRIDAVLADTDDDGDLDAVVGGNIWLNLNLTYLPIILKES
jgi:hypothetical protein